MKSYRVPLSRKKKGGRVQKFFWYGILLCFKFPRSAIFVKTEEISHSKRELFHTLDTDFRSFFEFCGSFLCEMRYFDKMRSFFELLLEIPNEIVYTIIC